MVKSKKKIFYRTPKGPKPLYKQKPKDISTLQEGYDRLERVIAHMGLASRREAKELIKSGQVLVNGKTIRESGFGVDVAKDKITVRENKNATKEAILVYKPRGIETSKTSGDNTDIHERLPTLKHLSPIGRLDKDSEGLIILTNDGTLSRARKLLKYISKRKERQIIMVTHGIFLKMVASYILLGDKLTASEYNKLSYLNPMDNAGLTICTRETRIFRKDHWEVLVWNNTPQV